MTLTRFTMGAAILGLSAIFAAAAPAQDLPPPPIQAPPSIPSPDDVLPKVRHAVLASDSTEAVGTRLVCIVDTSGSIDDQEYQVQMESLARSLESEDFQNAVFFQGGPKSIALCVIDFANKSSVRIPWMDLREGDEDKFKILGQQIRMMQRNPGIGSGTYHPDALRLAGYTLDQCPWEADKTVINVLTDGKSFGANSYTRKLAENHEATVNALVTLVADEPDLEDWARKELATPPGFKRKNGTALDAGFTTQVATQIDPESPGATSKFKRKMELAFRRSLFMEVTKLDLNKPYKYV